MKVIQKHSTFFSGYFTPKTNTFEQAPVGFIINEINGYNTLSYHFSIDYCCSYDVGCCAEPLNT